MKNDDKPDYDGIRDRIHNLRVKMDMTQEEFAEAAGLTSRGVSFIETGRRKTGLTTLYRIVKNLNVSFDYLVMGGF